MASGCYTKFKLGLMTKKFDLSADTIKVALLHDTYTFDATNHDYASPITTNELTTTGGYTAGGAALGTPTVTEGTTTKFDGVDSSWGSATFTARYAVLYDTTVHATVNNLICCVDFGSNQTVSSGTFTIVWDTNGIITLA